MTFETGLAEFARETMERWSVPGMSVGVDSPDGREAWAFGVTALDTRFSVREDTLFQIGSISKPFTATLVMQLVEQGAVDLDAPVSDYVQDLRLGDPAAPGKITVRHLLTHQGGFWGDWFDDFGMADDAIERFVDEYGRLPQVFEPGTMWAYNNCGYILAGLVTARVTGQTFEQALRERVIEPLELDHTVLSAAEAIAYPVAIGHTINPDDQRPEVARQFLRPRARNPAGGVLASVIDVLRFARSHLNPDGTVLSVATAAEMRAPHVETFEAGGWWGLGFKIERYDGAEVVGHGGATNGFRALLQMVPERDFAVAVLTNSDGGSQAAAELSDWVLSERLGVSPPCFATVDVGRDELDEMAGMYEQPYATLDARVSGDGLQARLTSHSPYSERSDDAEGVWTALRAIGEGRFIFTDSDLRGSQLKFWRTQDGEIRFAQVGGRLYVPGSWGRLMGELE